MLARHRSCMRSNLRTSSLDVVGLFWLRWHYPRGSCLWTTHLQLWSLFSRKIGGCAPMIGGSHFSASPGESNLRCWRKKITFYPLQGAKQFMGVCPPSPHVFCGERISSLQMMSTLSAPQALQHALEQFARTKKLG